MALLRPIWRPQKQKNLKAFQSLKNYLDKSMIANARFVLSRDRGESGTLRAGLSPSGADCVALRRPKTHGEDCSHDS